MKKIQLPQILFVLVFFIFNMWVSFAETEVPRGNVVLRWDYVQGSVNGYAIYLWDGYAYREIDRVSQDVLEWDSDEARIYPKEETLASYGSNSVTDSLFTKKGKGERLRNNPNDLYYVMKDGMAHSFVESKDTYIFKIGTVNEFNEVNLSEPIFIKLDNWEDANIRPPVVDLVINNGDTKTNNRTVQLSITASDDTTENKDLMMRFANEEKDNFSAWESFNSSKSWQLSTGEGEKTVFIEVKDKNAAVTTASDKIVFEELKVENLDFGLKTRNGAYATKNNNVEIELGIDDYDNYFCRYKIDGEWEDVDISSEGIINIALERDNKNKIKVKLESKDGRKIGEEEIIIWKL